MWPCLNVTTWRRERSDRAIRSAQKLIDRQKITYPGNNQSIPITYQRQSINCNICFNTSAHFAHKFFVPEFPIQFQKKLHLKICWCQPLPVITKSKACQAEKSFDHI